MFLQSKVQESPPCKSNMENFCTTKNELFSGYYVAVTNSAWSPLYIKIVTLLRDTRQLKELSIFNTCSIRCTIAEDALPPEYATSTFSLSRTSRDFPNAERNL